MKALNDFSVKFMMALLLAGSGFLLNQLREDLMTVPAYCADLHVQEQGVRKVQCLRLKGHIFSGWTTSDGYSLRQDGSILQVRLHSRPAIFDGQNFDFRVRLPKDVEAVTFGNEKTLIWLRDPSCRLLSMSASD